MPRTQGVLALFLLLSSALAQNPPGCAVSCLGSTQTECSPVSVQNLACLCRSASAQNALFGCVQGACSQNDIQTARSFFDGVCAAVTQSSSTPNPTTTDPSGSPTSPNPSPSDSGNTTPSTTDAEQSQSNLQTPSNTSIHPKSRAAVIGGAVGGAVGGLALIALLALAFLLVRRRRRRRASRNPRPQTSSEKQFQPPIVGQHASGDSYNPYGPQAGAGSGGAISAESHTGTPIGPYIARPFVASPTAMDPGVQEREGLTVQQNETVQRMLAQGADPVVVRDVVDRMRAENRGERTAPPQYDFKDATEAAV